MKTRLMLLVVITGFLLAAWFGRTQLAERVISSVLKSQGAVRSDIEIGQLGFSQAYIPHLDLVVNTNTGTLNVRLTEAEIVYSMKALADGRAESLKISSLVLDYSRKDGAQGPDETSDALEPVAMIAALRRALREYVIFDSFHVDRLILGGDAFGFLHERPLQLAGTNDGTKTDAEISLIEHIPDATAGPVRQLGIRQLSDQRIAIALYFSEEPDHKLFDLDIDITDASIAAEFGLEPLALSHWLEPFVHLQGIRQAAPVRGKLAVRLTDNETINISATAATRQLHLDAYRGENIAIDLAFSAPAGFPFSQINLLENSTIKAERLEFDELAITGMHIRGAGSLRISDTSWSYDGELGTGRFTVSAQSRSLSIANADAQVSLKPGRITSTGTVTMAGIPAKYRHTLVHDFLSKAGKLAIEPIGAMDLGAGDYRLSQLLAPWTYGFDLVAGQIWLTTDAAWSLHQDLDLVTRIKINDAGGRYDELVFSGLNADHNLNIAPQLVSRDAGTITIEYLDGGVIASNINARLKIQTADTGSLPIVNIQGLRGEIFDGTFSSDDIAFDLNRSVNRFKLNTRDIDLARVVETQQLQDIAVTGTVNGTIPVEINENGIFIDHGAFASAVQNGTIRYTPATGTDRLKQNPLTGIALDALRDFRYDHLSADVNYTPEGVLTINLKLQGTSPELETTRPVHLNINTEQNLLSLLKSLRYADGISAKIDKKVRRKYKNTDSSVPPE